MNKISITELPATLQEDVRSMLSAFDKVYVTRENGQFSASTGIALTAYEKAADFATFIITKFDVFTKAEREENYKNLTSGNWSDFMNN